MKSKPLVSIITPYYDAPDLYRQALHSLQEQTYENFEIVVVDDASPDPPAQEILAEFTFPRVKVVRHSTNTGPQTARNTAVANSCGDYILSFDCDDMLAPEYLSETVRALEDERFAGAYTQIVLFGDKSGVWTPQPTLLGVMSATNSGPNTFLYRREVFDSVGGYNPRIYCSDAALWLAALAAGFEFTLVERPLMHYRVRSQGRLARLVKHEHVPELAGEFPELYKTHSNDLLRLQEERFHSLLAGYEYLSASEQKLRAKCEELRAELAARKANDGEYAV